MEWQYAFRHTSLVLETMSVREAHDVSVLSQLDPEGPAAWPVAIQDYVAAAGVQVPEAIAGRKTLLKELRERLQHVS